MKQLTSLFGCGGFYDLLLNLFKASSLEDPLGLMFKGSTENEAKYIFSGLNAHHFPALFLFYFHSSFESFNPYDHYAAFSIPLMSIRMLHNY